MRQKKPCCRDVENLNAATKMAIQDLQKIKLLSKIHLHLGSTILKPELDLFIFQAKSLTKIQPLLFIRMRTLFEETKKKRTKLLNHKEQH
jgi:hypothetical protein